MFLNGLYGFPSAAAQVVTTAFDMAYNAITTALNVSIMPGTNAIGSVSLGGNARQSAVGIAASVSPAGILSVSAGEGFGLFTDVFDALDTTNRWSTTGTVTAAITGNSLISLACGAPLSASCGLVSQPTFLSQGNSSLVVGWTMQNESINSTAGTLYYLNSHRFCGVGTVPPTWTAAYTGSATSGPLLNAIGYEIDIDGKMYPVIYNNGVRTRPALAFGGTDIATGNGTGTGTTFGGLHALADGLLHEVAVVIRPDVIFWYIDQFDLPIATLSFAQSSFVLPAVLALPLRFHSINGASLAPSGTMAFQVGSVAVNDSGAQSTLLSDGVYPWRKATIKPASTAATATDTALVVAISPNNVGNVTLGSPAQLSNAAPVTSQNLPWQSLRTTDEPFTLFADSYDTLDTTNRWTVSAGGAAVAPTVASSVLTIAAGTTLSAFTKMTSQTTFPQVAQSYLSPVFVVKIDATVTTNNYRFFGVGTSPATPTMAAPMTDGIGFEIVSSGVMNCVIWQNGAKVVTLPITRPSDTLYHRYSFYYKTSRIYWMLDNTDISIASASATTVGYAPPAVSALPLLQQSVNDPLPRRR
jgi:hypothetical protein